MKVMTFRSLCRLAPYFPSFGDFYCVLQITSLPSSFSFVFLFLIACGDIHPNPGPVSISESASSSGNEDSLYMDIANSGFSVMHLNIQSLKPKLDLLDIEAQSYDILVFTETWLSPTINNEDLHIQNFCEPFRCDRRDRVGGGVAIYVREGVIARERPDLSLNGLEALWVEITIQHKKLLIGGIYRPPDSNNHYWQLMEQSIDLAFSQTCDNVLLTGDFNLNLLNSQSNKINRLLNSYNAEQLITSPTHYTEHSSSLIDLIFVKNSHHVRASFVADPFIPDLVRFHCPIVAVLKFRKISQSSFKRRVWLYDRADYSRFRENLHSIDWNSILSSDNIDKVTNSISETILATASDSIPNKTVTIRPGDIPWMNNNIRKLIRKRNRIHKNAKTENTKTLWDKFRKIRNNVTKLIRQSKHEYQRKLIEKVNTTETNSKEWFKLYKKLTDKNVSKSIPTLTLNNVNASTDDEKADLLNDYFCLQSQVNEDNATLPQSVESEIPTLSEINLTSQDVSDAISVMDASKACGPDLISPRLLREGATELAAPLSIFFNSLLRRSKFPSAWKQANVTPIFKKGDPSLPSNYRPVSLLSCIGKVMERCIHNYMYNFFISNNLLTSHQSGFIKGDSTVNQLVYLYHDICNALDEGKEVRAVFCDISKAFDRVWHKGLLFKLSTFGIRGPLLQWLSSYLSYRQQRVVYANSRSQWSSVKAGVPQGSILGPLLFLVYINDIVNDIQSKVKLFADDTSLYIIVENPSTSANKLNEDLQAINAWSKSWLVSFNPNKTESVLFSRKVSKPHHPTLYLDNTPVSQVHLHKHLGLTLSDDARWKTHISIIIDKAWKRIGIMRSLKFVLSRPCLEKMYISFIRPILEYANVVWDNCSNELKNDLEAVQNEAARIITGATKLCNIEALLYDLRWETLASRRRKHKLILMYKMKNNFTPSYLSDLIPSPQQMRYPLRNVENIPPIYSRTSLFSSSFLPSVIRDWNSLPLDTRHSPSVEAFKASLNRNKQKSPHHYSYGSRRGQILHARLRLGCSSLNYDLQRRSLVESPLCMCGSVETASHFLVHCNIHSHIRAKLFSDIPCPTTINNLLYGNEHLTSDENISVFENVQKFIIASKRFT